MVVHQPTDHWSRSLTVEVGRVAVARTRVANFCEVLHHVLRGPQVDRVPDGIKRTRSNSLKMSERGWWREMSTSLLPLARRDRVLTRLWAVKLSRPEVGSSRMRIPADIAP